MPTPAEKYEARYPATGISDAQKQERWERETFKEDRLALRRTTRTRGIIVPDCAYFRNREEG